MAVIKLAGMDQLTAAIPHLLGFQPEDSLVVVPLTPGSPTARVDLPRTAEAMRDLEDQLVGVYLRHSTPQTKLVVACFSDDREAANLTSARLTDRLRVQNVDVTARLLVTSHGWSDLDTGQRGHRTAGARDLVGAEFAMVGKRAPTAHRGDLEARLHGDPDPVAARLPRGLGAGAPSTEAERAWALDRVDKFSQDGLTLDDDDATRLLVAVTDIAIRDEALMRIHPATAPGHVALWTDLTSRAPAEVRTPAAALLGFASWLNGDGANAWTALDQIPHPEEYRLAGLLAQVLEEAIPPTAWDGQQVTDPAPPSTTGVGRVASPVLHDEPRHLRDDRDNEPPR